MSKTSVVDRAEVDKLVIQEKKLGDSAQGSSALSLKFSISKLKSGSAQSGSATVT